MCISGGKPQIYNKLPCKGLNLVIKRSHNLIYPFILSKLFLKLELMKTKLTYRYNFIIIRKMMFTLIKLAELL